MDKISNSDKKMTECICPKCGATHELLIFWTGTSKPRKFCPVKCQGFADRGGEKANPYCASYKFGD